MVQVADRLPGPRIFSIQGPFHRPKQFARSGFESYRAFLPGQISVRFNRDSIFVLQRTSSNLERVNRFRLKLLRAFIVAKVSIQLAILELRYCRASFAFENPEWFTNDELAVWEGLSREPKIQPNHQDSSLRTL